MKTTISARKAVCLIALAAAAFLTAAGCDGRSEVTPEKLSAGIIMEQSELVQVQEQATEAVTSAPASTMKRAGLVGILGGAQVRLLKAGTHEVLLPMPQLTETQIPVSYAIITTPRDAGKIYRIRTREGSNVVVSVQLHGSRHQEIQIDWSSIILIGDRTISPDHSLPEAYLQATSCVQSQAEQVRTLADKLWPASGKTEEYGANIQAFVRSMKQEKHPRSIDALGILESGANWICTANANLATALLRTKGVPSRSIAVIPPTSQRLEMHRIVEYFDDGQWHQFDPSSLQKEIPMKPWQNIIMARTTITDEDIAMKPRMGTSLGCPYAQELEFLDDGITLWGNDFFWTMGKPLAEFEASGEVIDLARMEWDRFLETGKLGQKQVKAISATDSAGLLEALSTNDAIGSP